MNKKIIRPFTKENVIVNVPHDLEKYVRNEWLVTNGLGGYSSSTIMGAMTRKYHGLLIAALPPPHGRYIMLSQLSEEIILESGSIFLNCEEMPDGNLCIEALDYLKEFYLEDGLPVWRYQIGEILVEKRILMPHRQNTVMITYQLLEGADLVHMKLSPAFNFRHHEAPVNVPLQENYMISVIGNRYEVSKKDFTPVRMFIAGDENGGFTIQGKFLHNILFRTEQRRGYEFLGDLWNPGYFHFELKKNAVVGLVASTERWKSINALPLFFAKKSENLRRRMLLQLADLHEETLEELVLAADQFIIVPEHRIEDTVRAHTFGEEIRTVIAGYHWFTDWGRDTMICLEGLTLSTRRYQEARWILKTFAHYVNEGLIPNMFPEGQNQGLYHTADATLWFFHAIDRYYTITQDPLILEELLPILEEIIRHHIKGTLFGIGMDPQDKLMKQGADKYQLTWMDAKVGDWVVTPRRGKAVEINALWYNALRLMETWVDHSKKKFYAGIADEIYLSFNQRFWIADKGYLYDVVDGENGDDHSFRPNQLFAISLKYPVLEPSHWKSVIDLVQEKLLTPYGLRTLEIAHPDFKPIYEGDLRARDAAYHQGTVWPWLIGPFCDGWMKVYPEKRREARHFLEPLSKHLSEAGIGTISEIFNATPPYIPQGCMAQGWSVAELLRIWLKAMKE